MTTGKKLWNAFFSYIALDDVTVVEATELDAIALLADTWDNDLDPEVTAQLVQANVQAYLSLADTLFVHHICHWRIADDD